MHCECESVAGSEKADGMNGPKGPPEVSESDGGLTKIAAKEIRKLLETQSYRCALSGMLLTPAVAALDHVIPVSQGGDHAIYNVQVLHKDVNLAKGTLSQDAFIAICRDVSRHLSRSGG